MPSMVCTQPRGGGTFQLDRHRLNHRHKPTTDVKRTPLLKSLSSIQVTSNMEIPVPHLRRLPTDDEVNHCRLVVKGLDEEIWRFQKQLHALKERRLNHLSFISPIRCLPPELISEICLACVKVGVSPMTLNQVCGRFREIVNSTSELWSRIRLMDDASNPWSIQSYSSEVDICLIKSSRIKLNSF
jgi:hypothetical protein